MTRIIPLYLKRRGQSGRGFFLIEALVIICLFALLGLAFANSLMFGLRMRQRAVHRSAAMQIASDLLENQVAFDPATLTATSGFTDTISWQGNTAMRFQRQLAVTVNSDNSRTLTVTITDLNPKIGGGATITSTLDPWGSL